MLSAPVSYIHQATPMTFHPDSPSPSSYEDKGYYFALADINGQIYLVQISMSTPPSALTLVDIKVFKHELATIFRHVQTTTLHPRDVRVIEEIREDLVRYEEDTGTVFLAREIVDKMSKLMRRTMSSMPAAIGRRRLSLQPQYSGLYAQYDPLGPIRSFHTNSKKIHG